MKLTKMENRIVNYVAQGMTNRQICDQTGITMKTLHFHFGNIYRKFEVNDRSSLLHCISISSVAQLDIHQFDLVDDLTTRVREAEALLKRTGVTTKHIRSEVEAYWEKWKDCPL